MPRSSTWGETSSKTDASFSTRGASRTSASSNARPSSDARNESTTQTSSSSRTEHVEKTSEPEARTPNDFGMASHGSGAGAWRVNEHEVKRIVASDADRLARIDVPKQAGVEGQAAGVVGQAAGEPFPGDAGLVADRVDPGYVADATLADGRLLQKQRLGCPALANLEDARGGCG